MVLARLHNIVSELPQPVVKGRIVESTGVLVEAECPSAFVGELCQLCPGSHSNSTYLEVVGFRHDKVLLMPHGPLTGIAKGDEIIATRQRYQIAVGSQYLGRVVDAYGRPLDEQGPIQSGKQVSLPSHPINPLSRSPITEPLATGVRAIDSFLTLGEGQRIGVMAGSGVGKSSLLSTLCSQVATDVNVIALIGERGREVEEFVNRTLGSDGMQRSVVIAATAQESPLARVNAAYAAIAHAQHFAEQGKSVLLTMDSITRFAMALREIGLAAGEPPTAKGYTPSVFRHIPNIIEYCGKFNSGGSITAVFTVLVESDDFTDPVVDAVRAILDGHIVLSRQLAEKGHYPAIDISKSVSRLFTQLHQQDVIQAANKLRKVFSDYVQNREFLELDITNVADKSQMQNLRKQWQILESHLQQSATESTPLNESLAQLVKMADAAHG